MARGPARSSAADALMPTIDRLVETRYDAARSRVEDIRMAHPHLGTEAVVDELVRRYTRELAAVAAASGGAAAVPGIGTATSLAAAGADLAYTMTKLGEMILAIGVAFGHDADSLSERKAWVLAVLSMGRGAVVGVDGLAGRVGSTGGARIVRSITSTQLDRVNSKLAAKLLAKLTTEQAALRMGRLLPFGIGAGVGAAGNVMIVRSIARAARQFFADTHPGGPGAPGAPPGRPGAIDVTATERPSPAED